MNRSLLRGLILIGALSLTSIAGATSYYDPGECHIQCWNGATAGPYLSTAESCCEDFQALCGSVGQAYTEYGTYPYPSRVYCFEA